MKKGTLLFIALFFIAPFLCAQDTTYYIASCVSSGKYITLGQSTFSIETKYGVMYADSINEDITRFVFLSNNEFIEDAKFDIKTSRFCLPGSTIQERFGTTIWLADGADMKYGAFIKKYRLENDRDAVRLKEHSRVLFNKIHSNVAGCVFREIYCRVKVMDKRFD